MMPIRRRSPALSAECDYSRALYLDPPSHDFLVWLVMAEMMRRHHNAGPLKVTFGLFQGQLGVYDFGPLSPWKVGEDGRIATYRCGVSKAYSDQMMANVLRPAIDMLGATEEPAIHAPFQWEEIRHHADYDHHIGALVDASKVGFTVPKWQPPQWAFDEVDSFLEGRKPVVITLRENAVQPERNSNLAAWLAFADSIKDEHPCLFVRDTCKAFVRLRGFSTYRRASKNAYVRAALYQRALVNMFACTGPGGWCLFSDAPYLMFKQLVPALANWDHGAAKGWKEQAHLEIGEQYPWATPRQRMTWCDDTFENIRDEFNSFMESL